MRPSPKTYLVSILLLFLSAVLLLSSWDNSISLTGLLSVVDVAPQGFEFEIPTNVSRQAAFQSLQETQKIVDSMEKKNYSVSYVKDALLEANFSYREGDYVQVLKIQQLVLFVESRKDDFTDNVKLLSQQQQESEQQEIVSNESQQLLQQARKAFQNDQLDEAFTLLEQAKLELQKARSEHSRLSGLVKFSKSFLARNWWKILIVLSLLAIISKPFYKIIKKKRLQHKLTSLREEYHQTEGLIKQLQKECFVDKKISVATYRTKTSKFEERLSEIKHTIPVIEEQLRGKKGDKENADLKKEKRKPKGVIEITK